VKFIAMYYRVKDAIKNGKREKKNQKSQKNQKKSKNQKIGENFFPKLSKKRD
jgi:hypothetical protein